MQPKTLLKGLMLAVFLLGMFSTTSQAQWFHLPGFLQRYEIGYSYSIATATYKESNTINGSEVNYSKNVTSTAGLGAQIGFTIPLKKISPKCMLALGIGLDEILYTWNYQQPAFTIDQNGNGVYDFSNETSASSFGGSFQMGLPLSADFKFGNDAFLNKNVRWGCTLGAGVMPIGAVTADLDNAGFGFGAAPFVKAEVSFFAGIDFKLRAQYAVGYMPFYTANNSLNIGFISTSGTSSLIGKQQLTFSLILMPFSFAWQQRGWWNTY